MNKVAARFPQDPDPDMAENQDDFGAAQKKESATPSPSAGNTQDAAVAPALPKEIGGPKGPEPTRYGDWERGGRCSDF
jgi:hypothetical protein